VDELHQTGELKKLLEERVEKEKTTVVRMKRVIPR